MTIINDQLCSSPCNDYNQILLESMMAMSPLEQFIHESCGELDGRDMIGTDYDT